MSSWIARGVAGLAAMVVVGTSTARGQEVYRPPAGGWSFTIPKGWSKAEAGFLEAMNAEVHKRSPNMPAYSLALRAEPPSGAYMLIQPISDVPANSSYEEIEQAFNATSGMKEELSQKLADIATNISFTTPKLDRTRNRLMMTFSGDSPAGKLRAVSIGHLGKEQLVMMHGYAPEAEFKEAATQIETIADSFAFDAGMQFVPGSGSGGLFSGVGGGALRGVR